MSIESPPDAEVSARADLVSALLWMAFGLAVFIGAWRMDRLENLHINKYEVPGLVPGILGAAVALLGLMLALRSVRRGALRALPAPAAAVPGGRVYMAIVLGSMLAYSLVLVGHGIPFWLATFVFVSGFIFFFDRERQAELGRSRGRQLVLAAVYGACASVVVTLAFQEIFYVRLP
ncbi:MAG: tripartite tricarboxylate transporter TctB family protein [Comamonadaceae bacterium]|nr:MAG: tripartite tricarboxylate transporter TctB family protein [Comamonadaceae bacterium]